MTPKQRKHFEFVRDEMHGEQKQDATVWTEMQCPICGDMAIPTPQRNQERVYNSDTSKERVAKTHENVHEPEWFHIIDVHGCNRFYHRTEDCPYKVKTPLYTTPYSWQQRIAERKPLTDEQMWNLWNSQGSDDMTQKEAIAFARAIEAAHGIQSVTDVKE